MNLYHHYNQLPKGDYLMYRQIVLGELYRLTFGYNVVRSQQLYRFEIYVYLGVFRILERLKQFLHLYFHQLQWLEFYFLQILLLFQ
jgi:hypothetical protein